MNYLYRIVSSIIILAALTGCKQKENILYHVESIMEAHPDSAYSILKSIEHPERQYSEKDFALYALLMVEATDKNNQDLTKDSLAHIALAFYKDGRDSARIAKSYFYSGRVAKVMKNSEAATQLFLKAKDYMPSTIEQKYKFLVRDYLGTLYNEQTLYEDALENFKSAYDYAISIKNQTYICQTLKNIGWVYSGLYEDSTALNYQLDALKLSKKYYPYLSSIIYNHISGIYLRMKEFDKALLYADSVLKMPPIKESSYAIKGKIYSEMNRYDSAMYYFQLSLQSTDIYTKAIATKSISDLYDSIGNIKESLNYLKQYTLYRDTIADNTKTASVNEMKDIYQHERLKEENMEIRQQALIRTRTLVLILCILAMSLIAALICIFFQRYEINKVRGSLREKDIQRLRYHSKIQTLEQESIEIREAFYKQLNFITLPELDPGRQQPVDKHKRLKITDEQWEMIIINTDLMFDNLTERLKEAYPLLNTEDLRLCCLLKMDLKLEEIARIFCVDKSAINKRRERIRKNKMGYNDGRTLMDILDEF